MQYQGEHPPRRLPPNRPPEPWSGAGGHYHTASRFPSFLGQMRPTAGHYAIAYRAGRPAELKRLAPNQRSLGIHRQSRASKAPANLEDAELRELVKKTATR